MEVKIGFNVYTKLDMAFRKDAVNFTLNFTVSVLKIFYALIYQ